MQFTDANGNIYDKTTDFSEDFFYYEAVKHNGDINDFVFFSEDIEIIDVNVIPNAIALPYDIYSLAAFTLSDDIVDIYGLANNIEIGNGKSYTNPLSQTPVPEPTTILLLGSGLVGLAGFRRKFKK
jgi:hypothetical protein